MIAAGAVGGARVGCHVCVCISIRGVRGAQGLSWHWTVAFSIKAKGVVVVAAVVVVFLVGVIVGGGGG